MELERLEVTFDANLEQFEEKINQFQAKLDSTLGKVKQATGGMAEKVEKDFTKSAGFEKFNKNFEKMNANMQGLFSKMESTASKQSEQTGASISKGISRGTTKASQDVQAMVDKVNQKMSQARAAQQKLANLTSDRNGAELSGDNKAVSKINEQIARTQNQMNKSQQDAQAIARKLKTEYDAMPNAIERAEAQLEAEEKQINSLIAKVKQLNAEMKSKQIEKGSFDSGKWQSTGVEDSDASRKVKEKIAATNAKLDSMIDKNVNSGQQYEGLKQRYGELKSALSGLNTELDENVVKAPMASNGMQNISRQAQSTGNHFAKLRSTLANFGRYFKMAFSGVGNQIAGLGSRFRKAFSGAKNQFSNLGNHFKNVLNGLKEKISNFGNHFRNVVSRFGGIFRRQSTSIGSSSSRMSGLVNAGTNRMSRGMQRFGMSMRMLWSQLFIFTLLYRGIMALSGGLWKALQTNSQFASSLNQIKVNLLTAFYPIYEAVLPAINAMMQALVKLTGYLAAFTSKLFKMDLSKSFSGAKNLMDNVQRMDMDTSDLDAMDDSLDDLDDGYDEMVKQIRKTNKEMKKQHDRSEAARKSAAKLKQMLMGFDEINTLDFTDGLDDFEKMDFEPEEIPDRPKSPTAPKLPKQPDYPDPWADFDKASVPKMPAWMDDFFKKFKDLADKLKDLLKRLFDPFWQAWKNQGKRVIDALKYALKEIWELLKAIGRSFMEVWTNGTGQEFLEKLLRLLGDIFYIIGDIARAFRIAWEENGAGTKLIQQIFDALIAILDLLHDMAQSFRDVWNNGTGVEVCRQIIRLLTNVFKIIETIAKAFRDAWNDNNRGTKMIQAIFDALIAVLKLINTIMESFDKAFASGVGERIIGNILELVTNVAKIIESIATAFDNAWRSGDRGTEMLKAFFEMIDSILSLINEIAKSFDDAFSSGVGERIFANLIDLAKTIFDTIRHIAEAFKNAWTGGGNRGTKMFRAILELIDTVIELLKEVTKSFDNAFSSGIGEQIFANIIDLVREIAEMLDGVADAFKNAWTGGEERGTQAIMAIFNMFNSIVEVLREVTRSFDNAFSSGVGEQIFANLIELVGSLAGAIQGIADTFKNAWTGGEERGTQAIQAILDAINEIIEIIKLVTDSFNEAFTSGVGESIIANIIELVKKIAEWISIVSDAFKNAWNDEGRGVEMLKAIFGIFDSIFNLLNDIAQSFNDAFASGIAEEILKNIFDAIKHLADAVSNIGDRFSDAWGKAETGKEIIEAIMDIIKEAVECVKDMAKETENWSKKLDFTPALESIKDLLKELQPLAEVALDNLEIFYNDMLVPLGEYVVSDAVPAFLKAVKGAIELLTDVIEGLKPASEFFMESFLKPLAKWSGGAIVDILESLGKALSAIGEYISKDKEGFSVFVTNFVAFAGAIKLINTLGPVIKIITGIFGALSTIGGLSGLLGAVGTAIGGVVAALGGPLTIAIAAAVGLGVGLWQNWDTIKEKAGQLASWIGEKWDAIKEWTSEKWTSIKDGIANKASEMDAAVKEKFTNAANAVSEKCGQAREWASEKWNGLKSNLANKSEEINTSVKEKFTNVAKAVSDKCGKAKDWAGEKFETLRTSLSDISGKVVAKTSEKFGEVAGTIQDKSSQAKDIAVSAFTNLKDGLSERLKDVRSVASDVFGKIGNWAKDLPSKIASGLSNGLSSIKSAIGKIANALIGPIGNAINGVSDGINWVLNAVGSKHKLGKWSIPGYAKGTNYHPGGAALVNDASGNNYQEAYRLPDGQIGMFPRKRNLLVDLPRGSQVLPGNMVPQYGKGIFDTFKDFFAGGFDKAKGVASEIWDVISNPAKLVDLAMEKFVNLKDILEPALSIASGAISTVKGSITNMLVEAINKFTGFSDGGIVDKHGLYQLAEGDRKEMVLPLENTPRALELMDDALDIMGVDGIPSLTMPEVFQDAPSGSSGYSGASRSMGQSMQSFAGADLEELGSKMANQIGNTVAEAIVQLVNALGLTNQSQDNDDTTLEVVLQIDSTRFGEVAVKGINKYHNKTGRMELIL